MFEVIDDFVSQSDVETIYDAFTDSRCDWHLAKDHDESKNRKRYFVKVFQSSCEMSNILSTDEFKRIHQRIKEFVPKTDVLRRIYFNCVKPGDGSEYHKDFDGKSVLIYANPTWKWYWGSGTAFENHGLVRPKPGRAVVFDGNISHKAISPNFLMDDCGRLSIVFQFSKSYNQNSDWD